MKNHEKSTPDEPKKRIKVSLADLQRYHTLTSEDERQGLRDKYRPTDEVPEFSEVGGNSKSDLADHDAVVTNDAFERVKVDASEKGWSPEFEQKFGFLRERPVGVNYWRDKVPSEYPRN